MLLYEKTLRTNICRSYTSAHVSRLSVYTVLLNITNKKNKCVKQTPRDTYRLNMLNSIYTLVQRHTRQKNITAKTPHPLWSDLGVLCRFWRRDKYETISLYLFRTIIHNTWCVICCLSKFSHLMRHDLTPKTIRLQAVQIGRSGE